MIHYKDSRWSWEFALILVTALWGWSFVSIHTALLYLSDSAFNASRFLVAALVMMPAMLFKKAGISRNDLFGGFAAGVALFLAFLFQTKGLKFTSASNASFITGLAVIFTPMLLYLGFRLKPEMRQVIGATFAAVGLALLTLKGLKVQIGDLLVLMCAASFAIHIIILSRVSKGADIINLTFVQIGVVGGLSLAQSLIFNEFSLTTQVATISTLLIVGILGTAVGFYIQTKAQVLSSPNRIALIIVLEPVFGGVFGYFLAGDRLTPLNWLGAFLILSGMLISEIQLQQKIVTSPFDRL